MRQIEKEIFKTLYNAKEPLTGYALARKLKANMTTVYNKIDVLKELGIIKEMKTGKTKKYQLASFYYSNDFWTLLIKQLKPIMRHIFSKEEKIDVGYAILLAVSVIRSR